MRTAFRKTNNLFHLIATMTVLYIPIIALCSILALGVLAHQYIKGHNGAPEVQHIAKSEYAPFPYKEPEPLKAPELITEQVSATDEELIDTNSSEYESNTGNNEVSEIIAEPAATESISPEIEANETENTENTITPEQIQESAIETSEPEAAEAVITEVSTQPAAPAVVSLIPMRYDPDVSAEDLNRYFALLSLEPAEVQTALTNWGLVIELSNRGLYSESHAGQYYPRHIGINTKSNN